MRLALLMLAVVGCTSKVNLDLPRPYKCSTRGAQECTNGWLCNLAAGFCIDPDAGVALACGTDDDCGRWRCSPNHVCVDRSVEGKVTTLPLLGELKAVSPLLPGSGSIHTSHPLVIGSSDGYRAGTDVLFDDPSRLWLQVEDRVNDEGVLTTWDIAHADPGGPTLVTTQASGAQFVHELWNVVDGGLTIHIQDAGLETALEAQYLAPVRSSGVTETGDLRGAALVAGAQGSRLISLTNLDAGFVRVPARTTDVAWLSARQCGPRLFAVVDGALIDVDGGEALVDAGVHDVRVEGSWLAWRTDAGSISWQNQCESARSVNTVPACPSGGALASWALQGNGNGVVVPVRVCDEALQFIHDGFTPPTALYDELEFATGGDVWARSLRSGALKRFSGAASTDLSLPRAPEALFMSPYGSDAVTAARGNMLFEKKSIGFLSVRAWRNPQNAPAASDGRFTVMRSGVVVTKTWVAAFPATPWPSPRGPVLVRTLPLADGGTLLAVTHDDSIDVVQVNTATHTPVELSPTVVPVPGITIRDLALAAADGGLATGYAIAGGTLVALTATTPTRWTAAKIALPVDVLHVWFDTDGPRAITADGTVLGLTALVALSPPTPGPAVAATSVCRSPLVLTDDGLYQLGQSAWRRVPGTPDGGFSGGGVFGLNDDVYVFDNVGRAWTTGACH